MPVRIISDPTTGGWELDPSTGYWMWTAGTGGGMPEAPLDGRQYGRQSASWTQVVSTGGGSGNDDRITDTQITNWDMSYSWGDHADAGYLTAEADPTVPSHVKAITTADIDKWNNPPSGGGGGSTAWNDITGKPDTFPPSSHTHAQSEIDGLEDRLDAIESSSGGGGASSWDQITGKPTEFPPAAHNHDGVYQPAGDYAASNHTHSNYAALNHNHAWTDITGKPSTYPPESHTHNYAPNSAGNGISISSGKIQMSGSYTGTFTATGDITAYSDENLKGNIVTAPIGMIDSLRGVEFTWNEDGKMGSGVIAQEVEKVLPHLVIDHEDGHKSVNYNGLLGYLIEEIKSLREEVGQIRGV